MNYHITNTDNPVDFPKIEKSPIARLAAQALDDAIPETWSTLSYEQLQRFQQRFAELLIQECASLTLDYAGPEHYAGWLDYRDEIKQHFGVK